MGGVKGEEKWRWDGTGTPEGRRGEGKGSHTRRGKIGEPLGGQRIKRECGQVSPAHLGPQETAEILGLILCPPRSPSSRVGPEGVGGREGGAKVKARPPGWHP